LSHGADRSALWVSDTLRIPFYEFDFKYARSSGKGGQNVNKVNSKAILSWAPMASPSLPPDVKERFVQKFTGRLSVDGLLQIQSERFRDQPRNVADCLEKLRQMILAVAVAPKKRKVTKPSRAAKARRLESKRRHSERKSSRRRVSE
jgi:ribosome-associated protein